MSRFKNFDHELSKITNRAIAESLREITDELMRRFGDGDDSVDWWRPDPGDPFWMLEKRQTYVDAGAWLKNEHTYLTTRDPTKALRFPSRFAADCQRRQLPMPESLWFEPTEHLWITATESKAA